LSLRYFASRAFGSVRIFSTGFDGSVTFSSGFLGFGLGCEGSAIERA
jgi:hypothetical protein